jgi:hypothetical protein
MRRRTKITGRLGNACYGDDVASRQQKLKPKHTMTTEITELDRLADAFVEQDRTNVKLDAAENGVLETAEMLRNMAAEQGGHWQSLDSDEGEQALVWAIRNLRC